HHYPARVFVNILSLFPYYKTMLSRKILAQKTRWIWIALLTLSPLAYLVGLRLALEHSSKAKAKLSVDRPGAIDAARRYLTSKGFDVSKWDSLCKFTPNDNLFYYYPIHPGSETEIAKKLVPDLTIGVLLVSPDESETLEVLLNKDGGPIGYTRR